ncbi:MAG: DUF3461 family protein [Gammaproteobacteria bacterium]|nr:DUF3461 family protein [Gammaproteobacteria bacterium]
MKDYPQLTEMGIHNPEQIEKYMVNGISTYDVLRVVYARQKGSLLPLSRTYKFPRIPREIPASGTKDDITTVMETNPSLRNAIEELKDLLEERDQKQDVKKLLLEQIALLEEDMALRSKYIKELAEQL